jgi:hypothetical protein
VASAEPEHEGAAKPDSASGEPVEAVAEVGQKIPGISTTS